MRGFLAKHLGVFDPDDIRILVGAFDKAWEAVQASGEVFDSKARVDTARAILAKHIIAAAKDGERDEGRLRDGACDGMAEMGLRMHVAVPDRRQRLDGEIEQVHEAASGNVGDRLMAEEEDKRTVQSPGYDLTVANSDNVGSGIF